MFDFAWSEFALVGVVALVAIGPKDMPGAIKAVATMIKKARRMAGEFQVHVDDLMKEADLSEMRTHLNDLRGLNLRSAVERTLDPDGSLARTLTEKPLAGALDNFVQSRPDYTIHDPSPEPGYSIQNQGRAFPYGVPPPDHLRPDLDAAPAFIPPSAVAAERAVRGAPAFIPPAYATPSQP
jgi:sec-independent protein translocase protein TatB